MGLSHLLLFAAYESLAAEGDSYPIKGQFLVKFCPHCQIELILLHKSANDRFILSIRTTESKQTAPLVNKHYQNEVILTGQSPPLKCCQPFEILTHFITGLDLSLI